MPGQGLAVHVPPPGIGGSPHLVRLLVLGGCRQRRMPAMQSFGIILDKSEGQSMQAVPHRWSQPAGAAT